MMRRPISHAGSRGTNSLPIVAPRPDIRSAADEQPAVLAVLPVELDLEVPAWRQGGRATSASETVPALRRLLARGRTGEALTAVGRATRHFAGSADVEILAGDVALLAGNPARALAEYTGRRDPPPTLSANAGGGVADARREQAALA